MALSKEITINGKGRVFVIPDIHGMYNNFLDFLDDVDFDFDNDHVISLGDLVDRGSDSLSCFNLIYKSWFTAIRGNHEEFMVQLLTNEDSIYIHESNGGEWFYNLPTDVQLELARKASSLPIAITLNRNGKKYGFVHGDIDGDWNSLIYQLENEDEYTISKTIWGRTRITKILNGIYVNPIDNIDHVYLGHSVIKKPITMQNTTYLDTGLVFGGKLSYVII